MYVVVAKWVAREGEEDAVERILKTMVELTNTEPACRMFVAHRSTQEPRTYMLYEQYDDEAGLAAHRETDHFKDHVLGDAVNRLEHRSATFYELLD